MNSQDFNPKSLKAGDYIIQLNPLSMEDEAVTGSVFKFQRFYGYNANGAPVMLLECLGDPGRYKRWSVEHFGPVYKTIRPATDLETSALNVLTASTMVPSVVSTHGDEQVTVYRDDKGRVRVELPVEPKAAEEVKAAKPEKTLADWANEAPDWARYVTQDRDGSIWAWRDTPRFVPSTGRYMPPDATLWKYDHDLKALDNVIGTVREKSVEPFIIDRGVRTAPAEPEKDWEAIAEGLSTKNAQLQELVDEYKLTLLSATQAKNKFSELADLRQQQRDAAQRSRDQLGRELEQVRAALKTTDGLSLTAHAKDVRELLDAQSAVLADVRVALDAKEGEHIVEVAKQRMAVLIAGGMERYSVETARCARENSQKFHAVLQKAGHALSMRAGDDVVEKLLPAIEKLKGEQGGFERLWRALREEGVKTNGMGLTEAACLAGIKTLGAAMDARTPEHEVNRLKSCEEAWLEVNAALREAAPQVGGATGKLTALARVAHLVSLQVSPELRAALDAERRRGTVLTVGSSAVSWVDTPTASWVDAKSPQPVRGNEPCEIVGAGAALGLHEQEPGKGYGMSGPFGDDDFDF